jgi:23S rRNA (guanosine2251-2'-O)-methyltransferase
MKQRGRNRPFWDKGGGRPNERAPRNDHAERNDRAERNERPSRESPGERAARAFEEQGAGQPKERRRFPVDERKHGRRRDEHDERRRREDTRPRREERAERRRHEEPRREDARPESRPEADGSLVFGVQPVLEALRAGRRPVERLTVVEGAHEARVYEILTLARAANVTVRRAPRVELQRLTEGANHQGVVAHIAAARYASSEELLDALSARVGTQDPPLALVLDGVSDPRNLGAIIRTAECAGAHAVFVPERRAAGLTETVAKAAAGALEYVPVARAANLARLVDELKQRGVWTVGTAADAATAYTEWDWTQPCALVLGGEGEGLRRLVREHCDVLVRIPLRGHISSLNVSVAAGVLLYEALRQRTAAGAKT